MKLSEIYDHVGYAQYAERSRGCATWLQFGVSGERRSLLSANFCNLRLCPMCTARRARRNARKLSQIMDAVEQEWHCRFLFLTLTVRNCGGPDLGRTISVLTSGWHRLMQHRDVVRAVGGWFRALEITHNRRSGEYHPHIHAILAVPDAYFGRRSEIYISQRDWMQRWRLAARLDYDASVRISTAKARGGCDSASRSASVEAAKYATKDSEYISDKLSMQVAADIVSTYTTALHRRRLTAFGGWLKDAALQYDAEDLDHGDLINADDGSIREDVAEWIETYCWTVGAGDYVLADRQINPLLCR